MAAVVFGGASRERVEIDVLGYEYPQSSGEYHDDNWICVRVTVCAGAFRGAYDATFQTTDLTGLRDQLTQLQCNLSAVIEFQTLEEQLSLTFEGNGRGGIEIFGVAEDQPGIGNKLHFSLELDQTQLAAAISALDAAIAEYPVRDV